LTLQNPPSARFSPKLLGLGHLALRVDDIGAELEARLREAA
jgi:hypothetical protein